MNEIPDTIYLQICDEDGELWGEGEVAWCADNVYDTDVLYVRAKSPLDDTRVDALRELGRIGRELNDVIKRMEKAIRE